MGCRTPFQMLYAFPLLMKKIRFEGGIKLLDTLWSVVQKEILENSEWESEAEEHFMHAWKEFLNKVESFDLSTDEQIDGLTKFMTEAPRNIQDPVWSRWQTVSFYTL